MKKLFQLLNTNEAYFFEIGLATGIILFAPNGIVFLIGVALMVIALMNLRVKSYQDSKNV